MLISAKAEYACIAVLELAARYADAKPVRLAEIADKHGIPQRFLVQILLDLKRAGYIASTRGATGGYALAKSPDDITLYDIFAVVDPTEQTVRQNDPLQPTVYVQCLRSLWDKLVEAQLAILRDTTLTDLVTQDQGLQYVI